MKLVRNLNESEENQIIVESCWMESMFVCTWSVSSNIWRKRCCLFFRNVSRMHLRALAINFFDQNFSHVRFLALLLTKKMLGRIFDHCTIPLYLQPSFALNILWSYHKSENGQMKEFASLFSLFYNSSNIVLKFTFVQLSLHCSCCCCCWCCQ